MPLLVSVIIPNYNHSQYLNRRITSVLEQSYQNIEVIILDDYSTDDSRKVLQKFENHPKISKIIFNDVNSGSTFRQWKKGIELAKGEWIWIAESDDWCEPSLLEELIRPAEANTGITISYCQSVVINSENNILYNTTAGKLSSLVDGKEFVKKVMLGENRIVNASMAIFRKSCFGKIPPDYLEMKYCGDWFFWVNTCIQGDVYISGKLLNYYLRHDNNVASTAVKKGYDFLEGNKVFTFINKKLKPSSHEKEVALNIKTDMYLDRKHLFLTDSIRSQVLQSMNNLDPSMKKIINKKIFQRRIKKIKLIIEKFLPLSSI